MFQPFVSVVPYNPHGLKGTTGTGTKQKSYYGL